MVAYERPRRDIGFHFVDQVAREAKSVAGLETITANSYTVLLPNGLRPEQIEFWSKALDRVLEDPDFKKDLALNFWVPRPIRYPDTVKWMQDDYDENRAVLKELGML